jgi:hypothetical protein
MQTPVDSIESRGGRSTLATGDAFFNCNGSSAFYTREAVGPINLVIWNMRFQMCLWEQSTELREVQVQVTLQLTVSQPVCLGVELLLGLMTRFYFVTGLTVTVLCLVWSPIWRGGGSIICLKSVFVIYTYIGLLSITIPYRLFTMYTIYTWLPSVQTLWSRLCLILLSLYHDYS